ncbi:hypothetical protein LTR39_006046, partial [Cryomyces antarcticus]
SLPPLPLLPAALLPPPSQTPLRQSPALSPRQSPPLPPLLVGRQGRAALRAADLAPGAPALGSRAPGAREAALPRPVRRLSRAGNRGRHEGGFRRVLSRPVR